MKQLVGFFPNTMTALKFAMKYRFERFALKFFC